MLTHNNLTNVAPAAFHEPIIPLIPGTRAQDRTGSVLSPVEREGLQAWQIRGKIVSDGGLRSVTRAQQQIPFGDGKNGAPNIAERWNADRIIYSRERAVSEALINKSRQLYPPMCLSQGGRRALCELPILT